MVNLRGQFALMALIAAPEEAVDSLRQQLKELERQSRLHAELHPADSPPRTSEEGALPYRLSASAIDRQGLVHQIAQLLRERNVNIENLQTRLCPAPITGAPLFDMELILSVPPSAPICGWNCEVYARKRTSTGNWKKLTRRRSGLYFLSSMMPRRRL
jgi:glycine cleavage system transcriptional repressor